jgi:hypothetical protein
VSFVRVGRLRLPAMVGVGQAARARKDYRLMYFLSFFSFLCATREYESHDFVVPLSVVTRYNNMRRQYEMAQCERMGRDHE